ncbi:MAG: hypothetical protein DF168_01953 [Candidatus Moanabacter tarae]|uniref:NfeD-like C-terminal domain-containing protein n=1 Tax=Candidatus Moanibacter tarae TaxID=2200854 RepID=A0A2Z4AJX2_9BACT|nr:MAG: hypothetical protein DF168_01953 [Candidatus Moanabacter tarae]|tara:strand:- start:503 stop:967 length:465 start_codon:yes stop_codon:yes gene_type:complete
MSIVVTLIAVALLLFFFEIFVPGGFLAIAALLVLVAACSFAYTEIGSMAAVVTFTVSVVLSLLMFLLELKILSKSTFGQRFFLKSSLKETSNKVQAGQEIIGKQGRAQTRLNPTGMVEVDGIYYEAFSQSGLLEKGVTIEVISQDNFRLIVGKI